jgi:radical SAM protein with 4Fe4S-binding SPASM domain
MLGVNLMRSSRQSRQRHGCALPQKGLYVSADFDLAVCPFSYFYRDFRFGNLLETDLADIRNREPYRAFRRRCERRDYPELCAGCACTFA